MKTLLLFVIIATSAYAQNRVLRDISCSPATASGTTYACNPPVDLPGGVYKVGEHYAFKADVANTGAATINLFSHGAKTLKKVQGGVTTDLVANDIRAGQWVTMIYDGTNMQVTSNLGNGSASASGSVRDLQLNNSGALGPANVNQNADGSLNLSKAETWAGCSAPIFNLGGTTPIDWSASNCAAVTFGAGNTAPSVSGTHNAGIYALVSTQDGTGGRTYTAFPGSFAASAQSQPEPGANNTTIQFLFFDGTSYHGLTSVCTNCANRGLDITEGSASAGVTALARIYNKASTHLLYVNENNGGEQRLSTGDVIIAAMAPGSFNASASAMVTADLTQPSIGITLKARALTKAYCISDTGSQTVVIKVTSTTKATLTCVTAPNAGTQDGTTGWIDAAHMASTALAANDALDLSGTANGTTRGVNIILWAN